MEQAPERFGQLTVAVVPVYEPGNEFVTVVKELSRRFSRIVVVNDGSTRGLEYFESVRPWVETILEHPVNRGKGSAIRTALEYLGDSADVVTVDADGQHALEDVMHVASALKDHRAGIVLGVRDLRLGRVPFRSWWGNAWTILVLRILTGRCFSDTQTGLRGLPAPLLRTIRALPGDRYDFELVMLASSCDFAAPAYEVPIRTIYSSGNATSHFSPLKDSIRNFRTLLLSRLRDRPAS